MQTTIKNNLLSATINHTGAELSSLVRLTDNEELIWQANPDIWGSSAPILFPITGVLKDGETTIEGNVYRIPKHGICRHKTFTLIGQTEDSATFLLQSDDDSLEYYPFDFELIVKFKLQANKLTVEYSALNDSNIEMLASIGSHPAFRLPSENTSDYKLKFANKQVLQCSGVTTSGLIDLNSYPIELDNSQCLQLTDHLFDHDALVLLNQGIKEVTLSEYESGKQLITMSWVKTPHLGVWAKPGAAFVCIEPWQSYADTDNPAAQFKNKPGISAIAPGEVLTDSYQIEVHTDIVERT